MKNKVYVYGVVTALFCALLISSNVVVFAQHSLQEHHMQTQPSGTIRANMERTFHQLMDDAMMAMDSGMRGVLAVTW